MYKKKNRPEFRKINQIQNERYQKMTESALSAIYLSGILQNMMKLRNMDYGRCWGCG
jgi:hypothetical protein